MKILIKCFLLAILPLALGKPELVRMGARLRPTRGWLKQAKAPPSTEISFTVFLKQQNLGLLRSTFDSVSDPDSPKWGQFLSMKEVDAMVAASPKAKATVMDWLEDMPSVQASSDSIVVTTTTAKAESLFGVPFHYYQQQKTGRRRVVCDGILHLPADVAQHVDLVAGISELWHGKPLNSRRSVHKPQSAADGDIKITPDILRSYYGIPAGEENTAINNLQAVVAFDDYYSPEALSEFWSNKTLGGGGNSPEIQIKGVDCLKHYDKKMCDQVESDLDIQYLTALGKGTPTMFHASNTSDGWVLAFTENALKLDPLPKVFTISYGWAELKQCDIAIMECDTLGYNSAQYVARVETNWQKLAVAGASIFVSDGDDGAQSTSPDGWDPLDPDYWCPDKWSCYPYGMDKPASKCGELELYNTTTKQSCVYPVGHMSDGCEWLFLGDFYQDEAITKALKDQNPNCNIQQFTDGSYNGHLYSECECSSISMTHEDVIARVYKVDKSKRFFYADYPTSSSFVTSVGASQFQSTDGKTVSKETVASIKLGAIITTGGGFSALHTTPSWQKDAVQGWINSDSSLKPPASTFDATKRGYPDISFNGHNYQVVISKSGGMNCPCEIGGVDGTSASSPAAAGMISLINGALLTKGGSQLGFLNPLLYKLYQADPSIFNDIVDGDNKCTRDYCMQYGYSAVTGWDPVAGLGSPVYTKLKAAILALKAQHNATHFKLNPEVPAAAQF